MGHVQLTLSPLFREEKGYGSDEFDRKHVDLAKGDNFDPTFLRLNPKATVPTLVVPLQNTLAEDVESRYKAITETESIIDFIDKSRSAISRTHTTSAAPAPSLSPATIAFTTKSKVIIDAIHSEKGDPNHLTYVNARNQAALRTLAQERLQGLILRQKALTMHISDAEQGRTNISTKTKTFWQDKKSAIEELLAVMDKCDKTDAELTGDALDVRKQFFAEAENSWEALKDVLVKLSGGLYEEDGETAIRKLEVHIGGGFKLPKHSEEIGDGQERTGEHNKLATFWDAMRVRPSWKEVYGQGLY
ncbi:hypothetical protein H0H93_002970 [Arthromyces matolae]|nr:hypothetical protein H0H93_002970 [Arthromyces matolae]